MRQTDKKGGREGGGGEHKRWMVRGKQGGREREAVRQTGKGGRMGESG